jgi:hypothetical protein
MYKNRRKLLKVTGAALVGSTASVGNVQAARREIEVKSAYECDYTIVVNTHDVQEVDNSLESNDSISEGTNIDEEQNPSADVSTISGKLDGASDIFSIPQSSFIERVVINGPRAEVIASNNGSDSHYGSFEVFGDNDPVRYEVKSNSSKLANNTGMSGSGRDDLESRDEFLNPLWGEPYLSGYRYVGDEMDSYQIYGKIKYVMFKQDNLNDAHMVLDRTS